MEPKIVEKPAFTLAGLPYHGLPDGEKVKDLWNAFGPRMGELKSVVHPEICYGVIPGYDMATGEMDYVAACEVSSGEELPGEMVCVEIPAQTYAMLPTTLPKIGEAYGQIYEAWLGQSGYRRAPGAEFEFYGPGFDPSNPTSELLIYVPIERGEASAS
jgi:predicted transcriptional regulator YdeE